MLLQKNTVCLLTFRYQPARMNYATVILPLKLTVFLKMSFRNYSALLQISLADKTTGKFIFNNDNKYELSLINKNNKLVLENNQSSFFKLAYLIPTLIGVMLIIAGFFFFKKRNKTTVNPSFILKQQV